MTITFKPVYRALAAGVAAAGLLIGSFLLGTAQSGPTAGQGRANGNGPVTLLAASGATGKITVTGTGTVTGTPNQLMLSMGVQVNAASVSAALQKANQAADRVIGALRRSGVATADIQTSGLSISPNYRGNGQVPIGYNVSEQLTATLTNLSKAGSQIQAAVSAGGNATTVDGVSLNLTDTSTLLARARAAAVRDAQVRAAQYAHALGQPLGPVISLSDQSTPNEVLPQRATAFSAASKVPVLPGSQQVTVQITVVYAVG